MSDWKADCRRILLDYLQNKLHLYSGLQQRNKMSKEETVSWINLMQGTYVGKGWVTPVLLDLILARGCSGHYGEFTSLNVQILTSWINQYYRDNQNEIDTELRSRREQFSNKEKENVQFYYQWGIDQLFGLINELRAMTPVTYHQIPDEVDPGNCWFKYMEECNLVKTDTDQFEQMRKVSSIKISNILNRGSEFAVTIPANGVEAAAKLMMFKVTIAKWVNEKEDIEGIFKEFGVFETRKKYFFV
jgi:hypothetical protein